jgi:hypothetical protein
MKSLLALGLVVLCVWQAVVIHGLEKDLEWSRIETVRAENFLEDEQGSKEDIIAAGKRMIASNKDYRNNVKAEYEDLLDVHNKLVVKYNNLLKSSGVQTTQANAFREYSRLARELGEIRIVWDGRNLNTVVGY